MTKKQILRLLRELGEQLLQQGIEGEVGIVGGAAMVLAFDARAATKDVDAIFRPSDVIRRAAHKIAEKYELPTDWLNDGVKGFLPGDPKRKIPILNIPGLHVWVPEPEYMLAMKSISARVDTKDGEDLKLLIRSLHMNSSEEVLKIVERYYPTHAVPAKVRFFIEELLETMSRENRTKERIHPWRLCPSGQHWVRAHQERIPPSKRHPKGSVTTRRAHCARNPSGKDQLYSDEIREISKLHFEKLKGGPCPIDLGFRGRGDKYDKLIAGWVRYWNDVLQPEDAVDSNLVKALIATESSFFSARLANRKNPNSARGLMQITNETRKILGDEKGELKDHFLTVTRKDLNDPSINICAGVRWLFRKRRLASGKLGREATWEEAVYEYKGGGTVTKKRSKELMDKFHEKLGELQKCAKK